MASCTGPADSAGAFCNALRAFVPPIWPRAVAAAAATLVILIRQQLRQRRHRPLLAPQAQRVDDADFGQPGGLAQRVGQRLAGFG